MNSIMCVVSWSVLVCIAQCNAANHCKNTIPSVPINAATLILDIHRTEDKVIQLLMCDFSYVFELPDETEQQFFQMTIVNLCKDGSWNYNPIPACRKKKSCGGEFWKKAPGGQCYYASFAKTWTHSRVECQQLGGDLVMFETKNEYDYVVDWLKKSYRANGKWDTSSGWTFWIGLTDKNNETHHYWVGSKKQMTWPIPWIPEHRDQIDKVNEYQMRDAVVMVAGGRHNYGWKEVPNNFLWEGNHLLRHKVCEKKPDGLPYRRFAADRIMFLKGNAVDRVEFTVDGVFLDDLVVKHVLLPRTIKYASPNLRDLRKYLKNQMSKFKLENTNPMVMEVSPSGKLANGISYVVQNGQGSTKGVRMDLTNGKISERNSNYFNQILEHKQTLDDDGIWTKEYSLRVDLGTSVEVVPGVYMINEPHSEISDLVFLFFVGSNGWSNYTPWFQCACDRTDGKLKQMRFRICGSAYKPDVFTKQCNGEKFRIRERPCDGNTLKIKCTASWSIWLPWSECSASACGRGTRTRRRTCPTDDCEGIDLTAGDIRTGLETVACFGECDDPGLVDRLIDNERVDIIEEMKKQYGNQTTFDNFDPMNSGVDFGKEWYGKSHEQDVRGLSPGYIPDGCIVSGSRDVTARVWAPNKGGLGFTEGHVMSGHSNFVSCVCVCPPDDKHPTGLILTGSNDSMIFGYTLDSPQPILRLEGHSNTVSCLAAGKFGTILSGSWDKTAKVWLNQKCVMTLTGHELAVWAVAVMPEQGVMLTGSADKTIKMWKAGRCEKTYKGHTDCVRGLAVLNATEFLSCSNDGIVRRWMISGECIHEYYGHTNYVYSIAVMPNGTDFVTSGEDRTLRVWCDGECVQTIAHPAQSVWAVCCLPNGDIATGSSDGVIRVFTKDPGRIAEDDVLKMFDEQVAASEIPSQVGDIKLDELPGPEGLLEPGEKDGQTKMIRVGKKAEVHQWSVAEKKWAKIGDVVGSSGGSQATSGKTLYEGQEYDYLFTVDIEEGKPPLNLPYNIGEDPWHAAQNFIHKNNLSQLFLDQVANFIVDNTKGATLSQAPAAGFADPFTGGGRYVPGSQDGGQAPPSEGADPFTGAGRYVPGSAAPSMARQPGVSDPFTGSGRYVPGSAAPPAARPPTGESDPLTGGGRYVPGGAPPQAANGVGDAAPSGNQYFPKKDYLSFDTANTQGILGKLKEFNTRAGSLELTDVEMGVVEAMLISEGTSKEQINILYKLLMWPNDILFPVLDVLRIVIQRRDCSETLCNTAKEGPELIRRLISITSSADSSAPNHMLVLRTFCNAFRQPAGSLLMGLSQEEIYNALPNSVNISNKNVHIAIGTLLLNFAIQINIAGDNKETSLHKVIEILGVVTDHEARFRLLVALGTLLWGDPIAIALAKSLDIVNLVTPLKSIQDPKKVAECAQFIENVLNA
ncbi:unnamed protein product [Owenia fusiformis]|uniref:Phospholipase A-2-activating protein n=1 Tax=Owenia fusiformis TaxID=6347 RepID=A0A8S4N471_OWEFU|nr:unnamed protein product [Owenia fusiformis]